MMVVVVVVVVDFKYHVLTSFNSCMTLIIIVELKPPFESSVQSFYGIQHVSVLIITDYCFSVLKMNQRRTCGIPRIEYRRVGTIVTHALQLLLIFCACEILENH
jgi:hypothetical protein